MIKIGIKAQYWRKIIEPFTDRGNKIYCASNTLKSIILSIICIEQNNYVIT